MNRMLISIALVFAAGASTGLSALDAAKVAQWEQKLAPQMTDVKALTLKAQEKSLEGELTSHPADAVLQVRLAIVEHNLSRAVASKQEFGHAARAAGLLESVMASGAEDELKAIALPYLGSATALRGVEEPNPADKVGFVRKSFSSLDQGVSLYAAVSFLPRYLRANVYLSLPDFFEKLEVAGQDLLALQTLAQSHPGRVPQEVQAGVELQLGTWYKKTKNVEKAVASWKRALALDPQKQGAGLEASKLLEVYGD